MLSDRVWKRWAIRGADLDPKCPPAIDFHIHSTWSDGLSTVSSDLAAGKNCRLAAVAVTDHVNFDSPWFPRFVKEVRTLQKQDGPPELYYGMEVTVTDYRGSLKTYRAPLEQAEIVVGVVHSYPKRDGGFWRLDELTADEALELEIAALSGLAENAAVDVIGHPGGTYFRKFGPFPVDRLEPVFVAAREHDVAIELNSKYCWDLPGMLHLLSRTNPWITCGSDAHHESEIGSVQRLFRSSDGEDHLTMERLAG